MIGCLEALRDILGPSASAGEFSEAEIENDFENFDVKESGGGFVVCPFV